MNLLLFFALLTYAWVPEESESHIAPLKKYDYSDSDTHDDEGIEYGEVLIFEDATICHLCNHKVIFLDSASEDETGSYDEAASE